jgi:hypothetical protein
MKEKVGKLTEGESILDGLELVVTGGQSDHHPTCCYSLNTPIPEPTLQHSLQHPKQS